MKVTPIRPTKQEERTIEYRDIEAISKLPEERVHEAVDLLIRERLFVQEVEDEFTMAINLPFTITLKDGLQLQCIVSGNTVTLEEV